MNREQFTSFRDRHYKEIAEINDIKGADYAGDEDALANFKEAAAEMGVSPYQIWFVYFHKHWSAIRTFLKEGKVSSEPIEGRVHDAILYLFLLLGLIYDDVPETTSTYFPPKQDPRCPSTFQEERCELFSGHPGKHRGGLGTIRACEWNAVVESSPLDDLRV